MERVAVLEAPVAPADLFGWVDDLGRYPRWLDIVTRAVPADPHPDDAGPAWAVDLRGRLGPMARTKRLRMVRTLHAPPSEVRFERAERDGREHSPWTLAAAVTPTAAAGAGSRLEMRLHYGGGLFGPVLDRLLGDEIERSGARLVELVAGA